MMKAMSSHERFSRIFDHKEADRVVMWDFPWPGALKRWYAEGMPKGVPYEEYFDVDIVGRVQVDNSPRYPKRVIAEDDTFITETTEWGAVVRNFKNQDSTPDFISYTITDSDKWLEAKKRITPDRDRVPWDYLKENYQKWVKEGRWLLGDLFFGFDNMHSNVVGTERMCIAIIENPEWCVDMYTHSLKVNLQLLDLAWEAGYVFDMLNLRDDLGYKYSQFFSLDTYRDLIKPVHKMAADWAHEKGIKVRLHSCGYIMPFVADFIDAGIDALHPMEVKAGMDPGLVKKNFGKELVLHGGINAMLWKNIDAVTAEIERLMPILKENSGYIFAADHSIPNDVSFENIKTIMALAKRLGSF
jgi:uroporphyrinogen decarboxylase